MFMKFFISLLFLLLGCSSPKKLINMDKNVKVEVRFADCIQDDTFNKVSFLISNNSDEPVMIHAWHLYLTKVYDNNGQEIEPHILIEYTVPEGIDEYIEIEACAKKELRFYTEFFKSFKLNKGNNYNIKGEYDGRFAMKGKRFKLSTDEVRIEVCE